MLEDQPDEQMARIIESNLCKAIERMRKLNLSPEALEFVEGEIRGAMVAAARTLRRDLNGGQEH